GKVVVETALLLIVLRIDPELLRDGAGLDQALAEVVELLVVLPLHELGLEVALRGGEAGAVELNERVAFVHVLAERGPHRANRGRTLVSVSGSYAVRPASSSFSGSVWASTVARWSPMAASLRLERVTIPSHRGAGSPGEVPSPAASGCSPTDGTFLVSDFRT